MLTPIGKRLIVQPILAKAGALLLPNAKPSQYIVISIGDDVARIKPNDVIYIEKHAGVVEIEHNNEKFLVISLDAVLAKLDEI